MRRDVAHVCQDAVGPEAHVLLHQLGVHPDEPDGQRLGNEVVEHRNNFAEDLFDARLRGLRDEVAPHEETGEERVDAFVADDEAVKVGDAGQQILLAQPWRALKLALKRTPSTAVLPSNVKFNITR